MGFLVTLVLRGLPVPWLNVLWKYHIVGAGIFMSVSYIVYLGRQEVG